MPVILCFVPRQELLARFQASKANRGCEFCIVRTYTNPKKAPPTHTAMPAARRRQQLWCKAWTGRKWSAAPCSEVDVRQDFPNKGPQ